MRRTNARLADHETPFIRNEWYVAALSDELSQALFDRMIFNISVLMYRRRDGVPVAMRNRCPHRSFPLSRGVLEGDRVTCGYHGLSFGPDGRCVAVPSQSDVPPVLASPSYPLVERPPFVWIWMGDPKLADEARIPDHRWLSDPDYAAFTGYIRCRANYIRLHENVLDLTHFPYVHGGAVGGLDYIQVPATIEEVDGQVVISRELNNRPMPDTFGRIIGNVGHTCRRTSESWFKSPGFHISHAAFEDLDGGVDGRSEFRFKIVHCFTPETQHSTHYFYGNARDAAIHDAHLTAKAHEVTRSTFMEDEEALELVEKSWMREDNSEYLELSVRGDLAGLYMRRLIADRAAAEAAQKTA